MKKPREFDEILNECIERVLKGEPVEACLVTYPEHAAELRPLLQTVLDTRQAAAITPRPEFRQQAAYEFQAAVRDLGKPRRFSFKWQVRMVTALSIIVVILMAGTGTVAAASNSLPDQTLYPIKLAAENVQVALTPSSVGKAQLYAEFADRRVAEIVIMADEGKADQVVKATERMNEQLVAIANLQLPAVEDTAATAATPAALMATESAAVPSPSAVPPSTGVASVPPSVSPDNRRQGQASANVSSAAAAPRRENETAPPPVAATATPKTVATTSKPAAEEAQRNEKNRESEDLKTTVSRQAEKNTQRLEEVLRRAPDNVKPALEKAIEVAGYGYDKALKNMGNKK